METVANPAGCFVTLFLQSSLYSIQQMAFADVIREPGAHMALVPGFEHDVFVSYSHVDDLGDEKWITNFHQKLEIELAKRHGRMGAVTLWRDERLRGNDLFDAKIAHAIERSALFLAVTSYGYLRSDYCLRELEHFHTKAGTESFGLHVGDSMRIYNMLLAPIPPDDWPAHYGRASGFPFHDSDEAGDDARKIASPTDQTHDGVRFKRQLRSLTDSIYRTLEAMASAAPHEVASSAAPVGASGPDTVFVADVSDSLASVRKRLVNDLERNGIQVTSNIPPPYEPDQHDEMVQKATGEAVLSVHLLDGLPGRGMSSQSGTSYPMRQTDIACEHARSLLIWARPELDVEGIEDDDYRAWLKCIERGERAERRYDFVRGSNTLLLSQILEKLEQLRNAPSAHAEPRAAVLVDTHIKDQLHALQLSKMLLDQSIQPYINPQDDDPQRNLAAFEARLCDVSSFIVLFGQVSETWVRHRLSVALQLSVAKQLPIDCWYVVIVPPNRADGRSEFRLGPVVVRVLDVDSVGALFASAPTRPHDLVTGAGS